MKLQYLKEKFQTINDTIRKAKESGEKDVQLASMLSSYLAVFISGIYENTIEELFIERAGRSRDEEIKNLVRTLIDRHFSNPTYENIKEWVKYLKPEYGKQLRNKIEDKNITSINSIVTNKNNIAHGKFSNATIGDIIEYHNNAIKIFEELVNILELEENII